ncbi:MAG: transposase, partial [Bifidobacteriaceae bacterium]|nr:transposase [Bifidobacteriaceae bacterium]
YFKNHLTNAIAEGINSIIQTTKRRARGFHTFDTFATMIYLTCGKLELATPSPFG